MIVLENLRKKFGDRQILNGVNLEIERGKTVCLIGGSGTGKSVTLKHIMRLLEPDDGKIIFDGEDITHCRGSKLQRARQKLGVLFQSGALLNWLTIGENVALPLVENTRMKKAEIDKRVMETLELLQIPHARDLFPNQISGGMQKRAGLARAVVWKPPCILYDEPTSGLDPVITALVDEMILDMREQLGATQVIVTHDMVSAYRTADMIAMLFKGEVIQYGTPEEIRNTTNPIVRQFIEGLTTGPMTEGMKRVGDGHALDEKTRLAKGAPLDDDGMRPSLSDSGSRVLPVSQLFPAAVLKEELGDDAEHFPESPSSDPGDPEESTDEGSDEGPPRSQSWESDLAGSKIIDPKPENLGESWDDESYVDEDSLDQGILDSPREDESLFDPPPGLASEPEVPAAPEELARSEDEASSLSQSDLVEPPAAFPDPSATPPEAADLPLSDEEIVIVEDDRKASTRFSGSIIDNSARLAGVVSSRLKPASGDDASAADEPTDAESTASAEGTADMTLSEAADEATYEESEDEGEPQQLDEEFHGAKTLVDMTMVTEPEAGSDGDDPRRAQTLYDVTLADPLDSEASDESGDASEAEVEGEASDAPAGGAATGDGEPKPAEG